MSGKTKLELTWIGKDQQPQLEPRILLENLQFSYHAERSMGANSTNGNAIIFGDNLLALRALQQKHSGEVKCIFIDPPYNTGSAFEPGPAHLNLRKSSENLQQITLVECSV